jgi:hypothetical protein
MRAPPSPRRMNIEEPATFWGKGLSSAANGSVGSSSTATARPHERFPDQMSEEGELRWPLYPQKIPNSNGLFRHVRWPCDEWPTTSSIPPCQYRSTASPIDGSVSVVATVGLVRDMEQSPKPRVGEHKNPRSRCYASVPARHISQQER